MWRALTSRVEKARAATGTGQVHSSMAANWAPPAKTMSDMRPASAMLSPLATLTAPNRPPIGSAAITAGAMSRKPSAKSEPVRWIGASAAPSMLGVVSMGADPTTAPAPPVLKKIDACHSRSTYPSGLTWEKAPCG
jgi:hypothetical protein